MVDYFKQSFTTTGKNRNELFDLDRKTFFAAIADAQKSTPDKEVSGKFLRPGQGHAKNISAKDLDTHDQRHGDQEKNKDKFFEVLVQPVKYFFHEGPPLKIEYRYFFTNNCLTLYSYKNYRYFYFK